MADYTEEFELAWKTYGPVKNSSKTKAFQAFKKLNGSKPPTDVLVAEITCYNNWLEAQSKKSGKEYPKCHMATWINQRRFESFEIEAKELLSVATEKATDGSSKPSLVDIPRAWMAGVEFAYSPGLTLLCPNEFHMVELEKRYGRLLRATYGQDLIIAVKKTGPE